jgi:hypothetical protein
MQPRSIAGHTALGIFLAGAGFGHPGDIHAAVVEAPPEVPAPSISVPLPKKPATDERQPATGSRGRLLYENHCTHCHASVVHVREDRRARSLKEIETWVMRWAGVLKLTWNASDVAEVVDYLNRRYYKIDPSGAAN